MPLIHLSGPDDPLAAAYRYIPDPTLLREHGLFVAEGRLIVQRLIGHPRFRLRSLLVNEPAYAALRDLLEARAPEVEVLLASAADISAIGGFDFHRGCLALVERPAPLSLADLGLEVAPGDTLLVVLEGIGNADNVGGIFRNAAAFGARAVLLGPRCCDPLYRKATRTSMGATLSVPFVPLSDWPEPLDHLRTLGYRIAALTPQAPAIPLDTFAAAYRGTRIALLLGAEGDGLSTAALSAATDRIVIPTTTAVNSLNVATAAAIALQRLAIVPE